MLIGILVSVSRTQASLASQAFSVQRPATGVGVAGQSVGVCKRGDSACDLDALVKRLVSYQYEFENLCVFSILVRVVSSLLLFLLRTLALALCQSLLVSHLFCLRRRA